MNLNQVTLPCTDLPRSVCFYETLGLVQIVDSAHYARFEFPDGDATLSLHEVEQRTAAQTTLYFECETLDETVRSLQAAGVGFDSGPADQSWGWREARLRDPDGNLLCLYHAGTMRKHPPWRIVDSND